MTDYESGSTRNKSTEIIIEILIWLLIASTPAILLTKNYLLEHGIQLWIGCALLLLLPIVFLLIFEDLPISYIWGEFTRKRQEIEESRTSKTNDVNSIKQPESSIEDYLNTITKGTEKTSQSILKRSKLFLFISCLFALIGVYVVVFSSLGNLTQGISTGFLPNYSWQFGILVFCLIMTLLFLRQYRKLMEDHLQFELIKKKREDTLSALRMHQEVESSSSIHNKKFLDHLIKKIQKEENSHKKN